jgi:1,4-dihydroxy-2-naphthoate octaprenyltransferase
MRFDLILPAASIGLLSTGVLNLNNLRDEQSDRLANKRTLVIILGNRRAKIYHVMLIVTAVIMGFAYTVLNYRTGFQFLFLLPLPLLYQNVIAVIQNERPMELNLELKKLSLSTLLFSVSFGAGILIR